MNSSVKTLDIQQALKCLSKQTKKDLTRKTAKNNSFPFLNPDF